MNAASAGVGRVGGGLGTIGGRFDPPGLIRVCTSTAANRMIRAMTAMRVTRRLTRPAVPQEASEPQEQQEPQSGLPGFGEVGSDWVVIGVLSGVFRQNRARQ